MLVLKPALSRVLFFGLRSRISKKRLASQTIVSLALLASLQITPITANAQSTPLTCTGALYQVQSGQLRIFDTQTSQYTDIGPQSSA